MSKFRITSAPNPKYLRWALTALSLGLLTAMVTTSIAQQSGDIGAGRRRQVTLQQQLTAGLKATTKADRAFIARVVQLVAQRRLPRKLVDSTFLWSRQRAARKSYSRSLRPIVYFQPALTLRAKRIGVKI